MIVAHDGIGAMLSGGVFLIVLVAAEAWARIGRPHPEWTRKLVHVAGGLICLGFPFVLRSPWIVLALSATLSGVFALGAYTGGLRSLHGVTRRSRGAEYYPLAVTLVFLMALGRPWLYVASIMTLAVADAAAALVGSAYGRIRYEVDGSSKSVEGSLAFFMMAFWVIHIPLLLMTDLPRETCLLAAALVALLVTGFEAVSLGGADNLFVPIGVCAILARITTKPVPEIAFQLSSLLALLVVGSALIRRTRAFNTGATLTFVLFAYGAWSLGSPHWAVPILSGLALYILVRLLWITPDTVQVRVRILFRALVVPLILLVLANATQSSARLFAPFVAACAIACALAAGKHAVFCHVLTKRSHCALFAGLAAVGAVILPTWALVRTAAWPLILALSLSVVAAVRIRLPFLKTQDATEQERLWTAADLAVTCGAALAIFLLQRLPAIGVWRPASFSFPDGFA
jgi:dolichol kinase